MDKPKRLHAVLHNWQYLAAWQRSLISWEVRLLSWINRTIANAFQPWKRKY